MAAVPRNDRSAPRTIGDVSAREPRVTATRSTRPTAITTSWSSTKGVTLVPRWQQQLVVGQRATGNRREVPASASGWINPTCRQRLTRRRLTSGLATLPRRSQAGTRVG